MTRQTICLAASGGGHVRQLLDLQPAWGDHDHFFVTEPTALGRTIAEDHQTFFVAHVAWGQAKLGTPLRMIRDGVRNMWSSMKIIAGNRPDIVITTGAGSMAFTVLFARLAGAKIVLVDSFARFQGPSLFARLLGPIAHERISQSAQSGAKWKGARIFDPFRKLDTARPAKDDLLFATVGATLKFPRLVDWVENAYRSGVTPAELILQVGENGRHPKHLAGAAGSTIDCRDTIPFDDVQTILKRADIVICHGGTGSLITALREGCHVIAIPRTFAAGEHYDDHQSEVADALSSRGLIQVAYDEDGLAQALSACRDRVPVSATSDPSALNEWLGTWIAQTRKR